MQKCCVLVEPIFNNGKLPEEIRKITKDLIGGVRDFNNIAEHLLSEIRLGGGFKNLRKKIINGKG